nr:chloroplast protein import component Tic56 [Passiflora contracta]
MASINLNFFDDWFSKPPSPFHAVNLLPIIRAFSPNTSANFASISVSRKTQNKPDPPEQDEPGYYETLVQKYLWECENLPDYRHTPEVEKILHEESTFDKESLFDEHRDSPVIQFLLRVEEISDALNEKELRTNSIPYRWEDLKQWRGVPHVPGPDGRPLPRKAIVRRKESDDKFWDFARQFFLGIWGFRQRPYPTSRPIDVAQAIGYKRLERRYYDFIMRSGGWYYKDRLGRTRGPMELIQLKSAWGAGIIDKDTFIWGEDMDEWAPIHMIYGMERAVATWEVRLGAAATEFLHKLQKGIPPWVPLKGREHKTYKQMQKEAIESKRRDLAVLEANDGLWPGVRIPSHALFLWASGSELTKILETEHMPNKYIPKDVRIQLQKIIPGLRPWEVLSVEQAMDQVAYGGCWYRESLGKYTMGPPYIHDWNEYFEERITAFIQYSTIIFRILETRFPFMESLRHLVREASLQRFARRLRRRDILKRPGILRDVRFWMRARKKRSQRSE